MASVLLAWEPAQSMHCNETGRTAATIRRGTGTEEWMTARPPVKEPLCEDHSRKTGSIPAQRPYLTRFINRMARKRKEPNHHALPKYVYIRRGWYVFREHFEGGKLGKDIKLCRDSAPISEVWQKYERSAWRGPQNPRLADVAIHGLATIRPARAGDAPKIRTERQTNRQHTDEIRRPVRHGRRRTDNARRNPPLHGRPLKHRRQPRAGRR
jgi:hypothetical protein